MTSHPDRPNRLLGDLLRFGEEAVFVVGKGEPGFMADDPEGALLRNAGERILIKVATVVEKLPDDFKERYPQINWRGIQMMRNLVAHHDKVNDDLLWEALNTLVPQLLADLDI